jgi:hypothetical protein
MKLFHPDNILNYTKAFQEISTKIVDEPLSDQAKISTYFSGITDTHLYQDLIIDPSTGSRWSNFNKLYDYVMNKYSILRMRTQGRPNSAPASSRYFTRNNPRFNRSPNRSSGPPLRPRLNALMTPSNFSHNNYTRNPNSPRGHFATFRPPFRQFPPHSPPIFRRPYPNNPQRPGSRPPFRPNRPNRPFQTPNRPFPPSRRMNSQSFPRPNHFAPLSTNSNRNLKRFKPNKPFHPLQTSHTTNNL